MTGRHSTGNPLRGLLLLLLFGGFALSVFGLTVKSLGAFLAGLVIIGVAGILARVLR